MGKIWRLILDKKLDGHHNMAFDQALFLAYQKDKIPTLRIYGWDKPYITLGCNQDAQVVLKHQNSIPFVKRITGGAVILHDDEVTYSLVCSRSDLDLPRSVKESYRIICSFLQHFYSLLGLKAYFAQDRKEHLNASNLGVYGNFCFSNYENFDLIIENKKIGGNAQKRSKDVIFQHGSIPQRINFDLINREINYEDSSKTNIACLNELLGRKTKFLNLSSLLQKSFSLSFGVIFQI